MKQKIFIFVIVSILIAIIGIGIFLFILPKNKENNNVNREIKDNISNTTSKPQNNQMQQNNIVDSTNNESNEKKTLYYHVALQGCIIVKSDSRTGEVVYKRKCESCGTISSTLNGTYLTGGTISTSFVCPNCKKSQRIQIQATTSYE